MEIGHAYSDSPLLCYANADMILMSDLLQAARQVSEQAKDFLLVGQRWNLDLTEPFDFSGDWEVPPAPGCGRKAAVLSRPGASIISSSRAISIPRCPISPLAARPGITGWSIMPAPPLAWQSMHPWMFWLFTRTMITATCRATSHFMARRSPNRKPGQSRRPQMHLQHPGYQSRTGPGTSAGPGSAGAHFAAVGADVHQRQRQRLELGNFIACSNECSVLWR